MKEVRNLKQEVGYGAAKLLLVFAAAMLGLTQNAGRKIKEEEQNFSNLKADLFGPEATPGNF